MCNCLAVALLLFFRRRIRRLFFRRVREFPYFHCLMITKRGNIIHFLSYEDDEMLCWPLCFTGVIEVIPWRKHK